jgi:predicted RNase H-like HicB family nuclease
MAEDIIRVFRMIEYVGPRSHVERQIAKSIHGTKEFGQRQYEEPSSITITATTLGEFPEIVKRAAGYVVRCVQDEDGGWSASVDGVQGCGTGGRNIETIAQRIREALSLFVNDAYRAELSFVLVGWTPPPTAPAPDLRIHYGDGETPNARCGAVTIEQSMVPEHVECKRCWPFVKGPHCSECGRPVTRMSPMYVQPCVDHPTAPIIETVT